MTKSEINKMMKKKTCLFYQWPGRNTFQQLVYSFPIRVAEVIFLVLQRFKMFCYVHSVCLSMFQNAACLYSDQRCKGRNSWFTYQELWSVMKDFIWSLKVYQSQIFKGLLHLMLTWLIKFFNVIAFQIHRRYSHKYF